MLDWYEDLKLMVEKLTNKQRIESLKEDKFFGYIQINFYNGKPVVINRHETFKPVSKDVEFPSISNR